MEPQKIRINKHKSTDNDETSSKKQKTSPDSIDEKLGK